MKNATDVLAALEESLRRTGAVIREINIADLDRPTPCPAWNVRDLLNHVIAVTVRFTRFAEVDDEPRMPSGDLLGVAPMDSYEEPRSVHSGHGELTPKHLIARAA